MPEYRVDLLEQDGGAGDSLKLHASDNEAAIEAARQYALRTTWRCYGFRLWAGGVDVYSERIRD